MNCILVNRHFNNVAKRIKLGGFVVAVICVNSSAMATQQLVVDFKVTPSVCIVDKLGKPCGAKIKLTWQASSKLSVCVHHNNKALHCWQHETQGMFNFTQPLSESTEFSLRTDSGKTLAQQPFVINAATSQKYRRRLRAHWSVF